MIAQSLKEFQKLHQLQHQNKRLDADNNDGGGDITYYNNEILADLFYSNIRDINLDISEYNNDDSSSFASIERLKATNPPVGEYIERIDYEKKMVNVRKSKEQLLENRKRDAKKYVSNYGLMRQFKAITCEFINDTIERFVAEGLITTISELTTSTNQHPVINLPLSHFFNPIKYERYIATMMLSAVYKNYLFHVNLNPRYAIMSHAWFVNNKKDRLVKFNGVKTMTFVSAIHTILNANHLDMNGPISDIREECYNLKDVNGQQYVTDFLNALLTSSLQAIYLLAINYATNEDVDFQRIDCRPDLLYTCNITNNKILKLDNTNTIYYKRGGEFIFRKDDRCYHSTSIKSIFDTKVSNKRKR